jgi:hypothetical protein
MPWGLKKVRNALLLLAAGVLIGGAGWLKYQSIEPERDSESLCASETEYGQTIVLVDKTDLWNDSQANRLEEHIWWLVSNKMKTEERLSIFVFNDKLTPGFQPIFSFCKPPSGDTANNITKSKVFFNRQYKKQFIEPLRAVLENIKKAEEKDCSPIIEVLFDVLTRSEIRDHIGPTRIVLISDLAQNSAIYSFYRTTKCRRRSPNLDPGRDAQDMDSYIRERAYALKDKDISVIIFQVFPEKNPRYIADSVKEKWPEFFRYFGISPDWQLL